MGENPVARFSYSLKEEGEIDNSISGNGAEAKGMILAQVLAAKDNN